MISLFHKLILKSIKYQLICIKCSIVCIVLYFFLSSTPNSNPAECKWDLYAMKSLSNDSISSLLIIYLCHVVFENEALQRYFVYADIISLWLHLSMYLCLIINNNSRCRSNYNW